MCVKQPEEFSEFEQELAQAMSAVDPPEGFAERVMARVQSPAPAKAKVVRMQPRVLPVWLSGAIAAALLVGVYTGEQAHQRHQREKAIRAEQQFDEGMRITDETLEHVRLQLQQAGIPAGE
jgi:tellurite resistance protein